jgi:hypothetical protein
MEGKLRLIKLVSKMDIMSSIERIQGADWGTEADSMRTVNYGPCRDAGAMLGSGEAQKRVKTLTLCTLSLRKTSPATLH